MTLQRVKILISDIYIYITLNVSGFTCSSFEPCGHTAFLEKVTTSLSQDNFFVNYLLS